MIDTSGCSPGLVVDRAERDVDSGRREPGTEEHPVPVHVEQAMRAPVIEPQVRPLFGEHLFVDRFGLRFDDVTVSAHTLGGSGDSSSFSGRRPQCQLWLTASRRETTGAVSCPLRDRPALGR